MGDCPVKGFRVRGGGVRCSLAAAGPLLAVAWVRFVSSRSSFLRAFVSRAEAGSLTGSTAHEPRDGALAAPGRVMPMR